MQNPLTRIAVVVLVALLAIIAAQPYVERLLFSASTPRAVEPRGQLADSERSTIEIFQRAAPSVVQVVGRPAAMTGSAMTEGEGGLQSGTGFLWDAAGHVVTNNHVVEQAGEVAVRFASGEVARADIVGRAPNYDLAVLRIAGARRLPPPLAIGTSADLKVGQSAFAIGNPFGLDQSLTSGIISALKRRLPTSSGREISNVIQTDAAINPGNSGGPLLDSAGRVIGVTTAIYSPSGANAGIGFAVPVDIVNRVVPELISRGRVPTPGIGLVAASEAAATRMGVEGVVVVRTVPGSPAERAGLRGVDTNSGALGDLIVEVNGKPVHRLSDLTDLLEEVGVGKTVRLSVRRNGQTRTIEAEVIDVSRS
ncbi:MAG: trypsin-like peptidase domain-containing protein [Xanthobacteraceae bacterium]|nr:trypsin-like peptidase domain-containing protein [Xanthobacteraceae bacterium]